MPSSHTASDAPSIGAPTATRNVTILDLNADVITEIMERLAISDIVRQTHVCRVWRNILLQRASIWTRLDLGYAGNHAPQVLLALLPRSRDVPFEISLHLIRSKLNAYFDSLWEILGKHKHRITHFSLCSDSLACHDALLDLLTGSTPLLRSLDVSPANARFRRSDAPLSRIILFRAPQLARVTWELPFLPSALNALGNVTSIRLGCMLGVMLPRVFSLFPRATTLSICADVLRNVEALPARHPLRYLELRSNPAIAPVETLAWDDVARLGGTRLPRLTLYGYALALLASVCESGWRAEALAIDYDDTVDAALSRGAQQCAMRALSGVGRDFTVQRLMHHRACLRSLTSLSLPTHHLRQTGVFPHIVLPDLVSFTLLCGRPLTDRRKFVEPWQAPLRSLLDDEVLREAGTLRAPQLRTIRLQARTVDASDNVERIPPAALARMIREHVPLQDGARPPELRLDGPRIQLSDDADGLAALSALVERIQHRL
ncbi:hypothetical protein AURDEDRAFT_175979 [Auricularia subglabra TFB-10046 SS5]|nr:hypothetical protein AURDEDRAFT_175979 [Auricularia subglabra TFB-10046 SS5]